jgi:hypothetical protein
LKTDSKLQYPDNLAREFFFISLQFPSIEELSLTVSEFLPSITPQQFIHILASSSSITLYFL